MDSFFHCDQNFILFDAMLNLKLERNVYFLKVGQVVLVRILKTELKTEDIFKLYFATFYSYTQRVCGL